MLTREAIVTAARGQVEAGGFEALSLRAVARELEVTAPALYDHVDSKADLLALVAGEGYEELLRHFDAVSAGSVGERLRSRALAYVDFAVAHPELFRLMFQYRPAEVPVDVDNELAAATKAFEANFADVTEAMDEGILARGDVIEVSLVLWSAMHGVATVSQMIPTGDHRILAAAVVDAMLRGLGPLSDL